MFDNVVQSWLRENPNIPTLGAKTSAALRSSGDLMRQEAPASLPLVCSP
jgi:hypothetical protein